ncbi:unnamed protein product [Vitrella brassicaformis CCMP3155]|uniref:Alkylglycerone-phosphate synthase n=3 Tax=Vitrella brassicaformis TaxID=1169539 RepID=A0A0G4EKG0_VITBC|nr:unnamed protein product [Vitrella brassicaformis CCMP3155]|eukprot:CEL97045.1 unnamed protein product [Vitrella brassicaformis CCMP3155]
MATTPSTAPPVRSSTAPRERLARISSHVDGKAASSSSDSANRSSSGSSSSSTGSSLAGRRALQHLKWNGWGFKDTRLRLNAASGLIELTGNRYLFSGHVLPDIRKFGEEDGGMTFDRRLNTDTPVQVPQPTVNKPFVAAIREQLPALAVDHGSNDNERRSSDAEDAAVAEAESPPPRLSFDIDERLFHSHGHTLQELWVLKTSSGPLQRTVDAVLYPSCHADVEKAVAAATAHNVALIPFGGGTSVTCALLPPAEESRMVVSVDLTTMARVLWVDRENGVVCVEAGARGAALEEELGRYGLTLGHEPDSWEFSTVGGWVATRCSGMKKNTYGNIEDLLVDVTCVTPTGTFTLRNPPPSPPPTDTPAPAAPLTGQWPRISSGPDWREVILGSEGTLGVVTQAVLRVRPKPRVQHFTSLIFPDFDSGVGCLKELADRQIWPTSIRLMDNRQFRFGLSLKPTSGGLARQAKEALAKFYLLRVRGFDPYRLVAATVLLEGDEGHVKYVGGATREIARRWGAVEAGEEAGRLGYFLTFMIAYIRDFCFEYGFFAESFETAVPWSRISACREAVEAQIRADCARLGVRGEPFVTCRISQIYDQGVCMYFYFGFNFIRLPEGVDAMAVYSEVEDRARQAILWAGGSVSHHHGVGKIRRQYLAPTVSGTGLRMLRAVKTAVDPNNTFANGALDPDSSAS